jgi:hypothetical protein
VEGTGDGHYIPGRPPVRFNPSVSLPIEEGVGWLVGGGPCRVCAQGSTPTWRASHVVARAQSCSRLAVRGPWRPATHHRRPSPIISSSHRQRPSLCCPPVPPSSPHAYVRTHLLAHARTNSSIRNRYRSTQPYLPALVCLCTSSPSAPGPRRHLPSACR